MTESDKELTLDTVMALWRINNHEAEVLVESPTHIHSAMSCMALMACIHKQRQWVSIKCSS